MCTTYLTNAISIAAGDNHTCAVTTSGGISCWGKNDKGQLGDGTKNGHPIARAVCDSGSGTGCSGGTALTGMEAVATAIGHTCGLTATGGVKCWGDNAFGQVGDDLSCGTACDHPVDVIGGSQQSVCGNGVPEQGEACDDGNADDCDNCHTDCTINLGNVCGDGHKCGLETCDDADLIDGDGCDSNCTPTGCGNNVTTAGEDCDDGGFVDGDGCSAGCTLEGHCGNGTLEPGEECDGGSLPNGDPCPATCRTALFDALLRHVPVLKFDSSEKYFPLSAAAITDNPGNELRRGKGAQQDALLINASPFPVSDLGASYPMGYPVTKAKKTQDRVFEAPDHQSDAAQLQSDADYRDYIYGRTYRTVAAVTLGGTTYEVAGWLQYWFLYYYNEAPDSAVGGFHLPGDHEGDWGMIQIGLDTNFIPLVGVFAQHKKGSWADWSAMDREGPTLDRPVVYVARGDHSSHFHTGSLDIPDVGAAIASDYTDGQVVRPHAHLAILRDPVGLSASDYDPGWLRWPGNWGGTLGKPTKVCLPLAGVAGVGCVSKQIEQGSPQGPALHPKQWKKPSAWAKTPDVADRDRK